MMRRKQTNVKVFVMTLLIAMVSCNLMSGQSKTGINTTDPNNALHVVPDAPGNDPVKIEGLNVAGDTGGERNMVVDPASGIIKYSSAPTYALFHARLADDQSVTLAVKNTLLFAAPLVTSSLYSYDTSTGVLTINEPGNYLITLQTSFTDVTVNAQLLVGLVLNSDDSYLGRGSHTAPKALSSTVGELISYTTLLVVPSTNYQIRFVVAPNENATVLADEEGSTGSGNVTNVTVNRI